MTALLDYLRGFSKINSGERFELDVWDGEAQVGTVFRPSSVADKKRVVYLFSDGPKKRCSIVIEAF